MPRNSWSDEAIEIATRLYRDEGKSCGLIALHLSNLGYKFSRNAVLGILHRKGIVKAIGPRSPDKCLHPVAKPRPPSAPKKEKPKPPEGGELSIEYIGPIDSFPLRGRCQYTRDDVARPGWQMCGHPIMPGSPWCESHAAICRGVPWKKDAA